MRDKYTEVKNMDDETINPAGYGTEAITDEDLLRIGRDGLLEEARAVELFAGRI